MSTTDDINASLLKDISAFEGSLAQRVYLALKAPILSLEFPPGAVLRKAPICEKLGVSRSPVSEAITRLSSEGLVDVVPQSATRVSHLSMSEIREGSFLREALELAAVSHVAEHRSEDQMKRIMRNLRMQSLLVEDEDISGFYEADEDLHTMMMEFTGFPRLISVAHMVSLQVSRARVLLLPTPGRINETLEEHQRIVEAIRDHDITRARHAMRHHLGQLPPRIEQLAHDRPELFSST